MWKKVVFVLGFAACVIAQYEGEACTKDGAQGTCVSFAKCAPAISDIRRGIRPKICSYEGMNSIVCCVDSTKATPTTSRPPVLTTSTQRTTSTTEYMPMVYDYKENDPNENKCPPIAQGYVPKRTGQKAWDKCIEYQDKYMYPCKNSVSLAAGFDKSRGNNCNHRVDGLIVGGVNAARLEFPHMALLGFGSDVKTVQWQCGGSIISERFILTAGHCTYSRDWGVVTYALVGILSKTEQVDSSKLYSVEAIKHPEYKPPFKYNDIALLRTDREIKMSEEVIPACLHVDTTVPYERVWATGWGATQNRGGSADILQKVILSKFSDFECTVLFPPVRLLKNGYDMRTQMCYGGKNESKDTCQGDSGGPLAIPDGSVHCMYTVVGVTSYGRACGVPGDPGMYSRVSYYVPWIESIVWP